MTYSEARSVLRKIYDERAAAAHLMEVCDQAAKAEKFLGEVARSVKAGQDALAELDQKIQASEVAHTTQQAHNSAEASEQQRIVTAAQERVAREHHVAVNALEAQRQQLLAQVSELESRHAVRMAQATKEYDQAKGSLAHVERLLAQTKQSIANL